MKTAMEKKETGLMRQIGYLSFVVVLLYGLTLFAAVSYTHLDVYKRQLFAVSCDNDEDPPLPPAVEKVVLAFGVDQGAGFRTYLSLIHISQIKKVIQDTLRLSSLT